MKRKIIVPKQTIQPCDKQKAVDTGWIEEREVAVLNSCEFPAIILFRLFRPGKTGIIRFGQITEKIIRRNSTAAEVNAQENAINDAMRQINVAVEDTYAQRELICLVR